MNSSADHLRTRSGRVHLFKQKEDTDTGSLSSHTYFSSTNNKEKWIKYDDAMREYEGVTSRERKSRILVKKF